LDSGSLERGQPCACSSQERSGAGGGGEKGGDDGAWAFLSWNDSESSGGFDMRGAPHGSGWGGPRPMTAGGRRLAPAREWRARVALLLKTGKGGAADRWGHMTHYRLAGSCLSLNLFKRV
jgi:hypothetical protein